MENILILGGTKNARFLAEKLSANYKIIYSVAGRTQAAILPKNCTQISGGFGGVEGLKNYLLNHKITLCIDATHPFAKNITHNIVAACTDIKTPTIQYARKPWVGNFTQFKNSDILIKSIPKNARVFLTIGSKNIKNYLPVKQITAARMIEKPNLNTDFEIILARPPFSLDDEINLMQTRSITHLVCKNSGGDIHDNKLRAAQKLKIKILMIEQPTSPHKIQFFSAVEIESYLHLQNKL